jgi:hypothetical protein
LINEVCTRSDCEGGEWIELFNPTLADINLAEYTLEDNRHMPHQLSIIIEPGKYELFYFSGLNDDGDCVILREAGRTEPIDQIFYGNYTDEGLLNNVLNNAPTPKAGESITRELDAPITGNGRTDFVIAVPTPRLAYVPIMKVKHQASKKLEGWKTERTSLFLAQSQLCREFCPRNISIFKMKQEAFKFTVMAKLFLHLFWEIRFP